MSFWPKTDKAVYLLAFLGFSTLLFSCNRKPTAAFEPSTLKAKVGQPINFVDQSDNANRHLWEFGDGILARDVKGVTYAYEKPGTYNATLRVWNKKEKNEATTSRSIVVEPPTKDELVGTWYYYLREDVVNWDGETDKNTNINEMAVNQTYFFEPLDTVYINDYGSNLILRRYSLGTGEVSIMDTNLVVLQKYQIVKLYDNEMIWKVVFNDHYRLLHFKK
jgi:PKD repeat protein